MTASYRDYRAMLLVHKHRLDDELEVQADVFERICSEAARAGSRARQAKEELAYTEARLTVSAKESDAKLTVDAVKATVVTHPERRARWQALQQATEEHEEWEGLKASWREKGYSIKTLAELYVAAYFQPNSAGREDVTKAQQDRRDAMRRSGGRQERAADAARDSAREAGIEPRAPAQPPAGGTQTVQRMREGMAAAEGAPRTRRRAE